MKGDQQQATKRKRGVVRSGSGGRVDEASDYEGWLRLGFGFATLDILVRARSRFFYWTGKELRERGDRDRGR